MSDTSPATSTPSAYCLDRADNVAVLLADANPGKVALLGNAPQDHVVVQEPISAEHKVALQPIPHGSPIIKHCVTIGIATADIEPGQWVHLHNCRSQLDERSSSLDLQSGAPQDMLYE